MEAAYRGYLAALGTEDGVAGWAHDNPPQSALAAWMLMQGENPSQP